VRPNDPANHDELLAMYRQGMGDSAIGKCVGRTKWAIGRWRRYHGLARFCVDPMKLTEEEEAKRRALYNQGLLDAEIAASLNIGFFGCLQLAQAECASAKLQKPKGKIPVSIQGNMQSAASTECQSDSAFRGF